MTKKIYRTAQGKVVDLGSIILQNENTRAVGNMGVNARGDIVDSRNKSVKSRTQQVSRQYNRQISNVQDEPVKTSRKAKADEPTPESRPAKVEHVSSPPTVVEEAQPAPAETSAGGLAAAIAKARAIKQEPLKTPRQLKQDQSGVTKI
jgi:hypothetical protein